MRFPSRKNSAVPIITTLLSVDIISLTLNFVSTELKYFAVCLQLEITSDFPLKNFSPIISHSTLS